MKLFALSLLAFSCFACASNPKTSPEWPEEPSPAYPAPSAGADAKADSAKLDTAEVKAAPSAGSSALAKKYGSKKALSTLDGKASYYADSLAGNHTANGDIYDPAKFTAAHKKLPFGTIVRVIRVDNGKTTYVRINDRGPFGSAERIIDLSKAAAKEIEMMKAGVVAVRVEIVEQPASK